MRGVSSIISTSSYCACGGSFCLVDIPRVSAVSTLPRSTSKAGIFSVVAKDEVVGTRELASPSVVIKQNPAAARPAWWPWDCRADSVAIHRQRAAPPYALPALSAVRARQHHVDQFIVTNDGLTSYGNVIDAPQVCSTASKQVILNEKKVPGTPLRRKRPSSVTRTITRTNVAVVALERLATATDSHNVVVSYAVDAISYQNNTAIVNAEMAMVHSGLV